MESAEDAWKRIGQEVKGENKIKKVSKKKDESCPYKKKYNELSELYKTEYGHDTGTRECETLLEILRAFELVFSVMK